MFRVSLGGEKDVTSEGKQARVPEGGDRYRKRSSLENQAKLLSISALLLSRCLASNELLKL